MLNHGAHDNIAIIHAVFGSLLALFVVPSGILIARYRLGPPPGPAPAEKSCCAKKSVVPRPRTWMHLHILCNFLGILGGLLVFSLGVASVLTAGEGIQFTGEDADVHHCLGLALTVLMMAQGAIGWFAHKKPTGRLAPPRAKGVDVNTTVEGDAEKGGLNAAGSKPELDSSATTGSGDDMDDIQIIDDFPSTASDSLTSGQGRGCCSGSDPTVPGGCACSMSNLNGAPCCCGGKGDRDDIVAKEVSRTGRTGVVRRRSRGIVDRMLGNVGRQTDGSERSKEGKEKKHFSRWFHAGLGLVIAAGLYWETWNGLSIEYDSMSTSLTTVPQAVQILFWTLLLVPVGLYVYSIGDGLLKGLGRMTVGVEEEERERRGRERVGGQGEREKLLSGQAA